MFGRLAGLLAVVAGLLVGQPGDARPVGDKFDRRPGSTEIVALRTRHSKTFQNADGTRTWSCSQQSVHFKDARGAWQDIDPETMRLSSVDLTWSNLTSSGDAYVVGANPDDNYGGRDEMQVRITNNLYSFVKWDMTGAPAQAQTVDASNSVRVILTANGLGDAASVTIACCPVTGAWVEGTKIGEPESGSITYDNMPSKSSTAYYSQAVGAQTAGTAYTWAWNGYTAGVPGSNGVWFQGTSGDNSARTRWYTKESTGAAPQIYIDGVECTPPAAPTGGAATANSTSQITWGWTRAAGASGETYRAYDASTGGTLKWTSASQAVSYAETGLSANTLYGSGAGAGNQRCLATFQICESTTRLTLPARYTLAKAPTYGTSGDVTIRCDCGQTRTDLGTNQNVTFTFNNAFGDGPANVGQFDYAWDQNATWDGSGGTLWTSGGTLVKQVGAAEENYYLHIRSYNNDSPKVVSTSVLNLGPYAAAGPCVGVTVSENPDDQSVCTPNTASFEVAVSGTPPIAYQWQKSTDGGSNYNPITTGDGTGYDAASYTTPATSGAMNNYKYRCYVTNCNGGNNATSGAATLTVTVSPSAPTDAAADPSTINSGESSTLSASVEGGCTVDWYTGSCGGTLVGSGTSLVVTPGSTTTYYPRARNTTTGCVSASCGTAVTVTVETPPGGAVHYVKPHSGGTHDGHSWATAFDKVQEAVDDAVSDDEVWVAGGEYIENIVLKSGVALYGGFAGTETQRTQRNWTANVTTLDGDGGGPVIEMAKNAGSTTRIDGFTVTNGRALAGGGIYCNQNASGVIANNVITGNSADLDGGGIYCNLGSSPVIANNRISGNGAMTAGGGVRGTTGAPALTSNLITCNSARIGGGICCGDSSTATHEDLINNTIFANVAVSGGGIYCCELSSASVSNNIIAFNSSGIFKRSGAGTPSLVKNCLYGNDGGDYSGLSAGSTDISSDPVLAGVSGTAVPETPVPNLHIQPGSPCRNFGNDSEVISGYPDIDGQARMQGVVDIGADESDGTTWTATPVVVRVKTDGNDSNNGSSWPLAKKTIQAAIDSVVAGLLAGQEAEPLAGQEAGHYGGEVWVKAGTYSECVALHDYVYVYGGFAGSETSAAARNWKTNVTTVDGGAAGSVVTARLLGYRVSAIDGFKLTNGKDWNGGGVCCDHASPLVMNNTITANAASGSGGGIYLANSSALVKSNDVTNNSALGYGGAVFCEQSGAEIASNNIENNSACMNGCGIYASANSTCKLVNNRIVGNQQNSTIPGAWGSGVSTDSYAEPEMVCNTIADNSASGNAAVYCGVFGVLNMRSNVVAFNSSGIMADDAATTSNVIKNCVYGNTSYNYSGLSGGSGSISSNPLFVNRPAGDYSIQGTSPCLETADASTAPAEDYIGTPRPLDGDANGASSPDMGCYEYIKGFVNLADAKSKEDGQRVAVTEMVSTALFTGNFYMEDPNRIKGIGVIGSCSSAARQVTVEGTMTTLHGERMISAYNVISGRPVAALQPLLMNQMSYGGSAIAAPGGPGVRWSESVGIESVGLLARVVGRVLSVDTIGKCFYVDDGSGRTNYDGTKVGLKVKSDYTLPGIDQYVSVTGIVSCEPDDTAPNGELIALMLVRQASDVMTF